MQEPRRGAAIEREREEDGGRLLTRSELVNLCCGLFGIQIVWGLQNVNTSRIFQTLGADVAQLPLLWIAAPVTGLLVQPLIGHWSDRARGRWGRRTPFIAGGTILAALALVGMASVSTLTGAVFALWMLMAAVNVAMQPFRALMADRLTPGQRTAGFATQVCFIGAGAVFASALPWMLANWFGVSGTAPPGSLPPTVASAFRIGAAALVLTIGWTLWRTRETAPADRPVASDPRADAPAGYATPRWIAPVWLATGLALAVVAAAAGLRREIYLLAVLAVGYGVARVFSDRNRRRGRRSPGILEIVDDIACMPRAMRGLVAVQFFTWFGLFAMWVYAVPAVALRHYRSADPQATTYAAGADWVGVLFALHDGVAAVAALALPWLAARIGLRASHAACLASGGLGLLGFLLVDDPRWLWVPSIGIGIAWASILATPYVIVTNAVAPAKLGVYMGIHNIFLVLPQLVAATLLGAVLDRLLGARPDAMLAVAAASFAVGAVVTLLLSPDCEALS